MTERTLQQAIREERTRRGLSQRQLANAVGVSTALVSWSETGSQPVSMQVHRRILEALELDPNHFPELREEGETQEPKPRGETAQTPRDRDDRSTGRRRTRRPGPEPERSQEANSETEQTPPGGEDRKEPPDSEREELLTAELERFMQIWSRMGGPHQHDDGKWHLPEGATKGPEQICLAATRGGSCDQETYGENQHLVELREGLVELQAEKDGDGGTRMELIHEPPGDDAPAWAFESERPVAGTVQFMPVLQPERQNHENDRKILPPGLYRLRVWADAGAPWQFQWVQHTPGTGWVDLLENPKREHLEEWKEPGLSWFGPTAPNWTRVEVMVRQEQTAPMEAWAYPLDGAPEVLMVRQDVGPQPIRVPVDLDPQGEYTIAVMSETHWDMWFVEARDGEQTHPQEDEGMAQQNSQGRSRPPPCPHRTG